MVRNIKDKPFEYWAFHDFIFTVDNTDGKREFVGTKKRKWSPNSKY
jgi:hypothetical protein